MKILLGLALLAACAHGPAGNNPVVATDAQIQFQDFLNLRKQYTGETSLPNNLYVQFADTSGRGKNVIGFCEITSQYRLITLDPTFWSTASDAQKSMLSWHEFGHCILNRAHDSSFLITGIHKTLMNPYILQDKEFLANYGYYVQELFANEVKENPNDSTLSEENDTDGLRLTP